MSKSRRSGLRKTEKNSHKKAQEAQEAQTSCAFCGYYSTSPTPPNSAGCSSHCSRVYRLLCCTRGGRGQWKNGESERSNGERFCKAEQCPRCGPGTRH